MTTIGENIKIMRRKCGFTQEDAKIIEGTAEATNLPDHSVDIITVAHALHWFDLEAFRAECSRILKPNGLIVVIYNHVPGNELLTVIAWTVCCAVIE